MGHSLPALALIDWLNLLRGKERETSIANIRDIGSESERTGRIWFILGIPVDLGGLALDSGVTSWANVDTGYSVNQSIVPAGKSVRVVLPKVSSGSHALLCVQALSSGGLSSSLSLSLCAGLRLSLSGNFMDVFIKPVFELLWGRHVVV